MNKDNINQTNRIIQEYNKNNQGLSVLYGQIDYDSLMLCELTKLENLSAKYKEELWTLSKDIRKLIWYNCDTKILYITLFSLNDIYKLLFDTIESVDLIFDYIAHLSNHIIIKNNINVFEKIRDDVYLSNAKVIISKMWQNDCSEDDGGKTFLDLFDDVYTNAIEKYEDSFFVRLTENDMLCRMVKEKNCKEDRFIPWTNRAYNRWNPPGKTYLYLSYSKDNCKYNDDLTLTEYVCLLECRTKLGEDCCFADFRPTKKGKILDLSYNDVTLKDYRNQLSVYGQEIEHSILNKMIDDSDFLMQLKKIKKSEDQKRIIKLRVDQISKSEYNTKRIISINLAKQFLKMICQSIFIRVDEESDEGKEKAYKSFHLFSEYLERKGITGIIYPCTRTNKIIGKNIVLFNIEDAKPVKGSIKQYHCNISEI